METLQTAGSQRMKNRLYYLANDYFCTNNEPLLKEEKFVKDY